MAKYIKVGDILKDPYNNSVFYVKKIDEYSMADLEVLESPNIPKSIGKTYKNWDIKVLTNMLNHNKLLKLKNYKHKYTSKLYKVINNSNQGSSNG